MIEIAREDRLADRGAREFQPARSEIGHGGHGGDLDLLLRLLLDVAQEAMFARLGQRDGDTLTAGAAGSADPMHVRLGGTGDVVVDNVRHVLDVESARGDVGGDEQIGGVGAELLHDAIALLLTETTVQCLGAIATAVERFGQLVDFGPRAAEHDGGRRVLDVEHAAKRRDLVRPADDVRNLPHPRRGAGRHDLAVDADAHRFLQMRFGELRDPRRERGREERRLTIGRSGLQDGLEILGEAHVEHLVRLVEHDDLHRIEAQRLAADVIERTAGRGDDHVDAALQHAQLVLHRRAAIDRQRAHSERLPVLVHRLGDLHRQLARGHEDQRGGARAWIGVGGDEVQQRERERGGLSGSRCGLAKDVAAGEQRWDRLALYWGRLLVAERRERVDEPRIETERGEAGALLGGWWCGGARCHWTGTSDDGTARRLRILSHAQRFSAAAVRDPSVTHARTGRVRDAAHPRRRAIDRVCG